jgi:hypothetical protein
MKNKILPLYLLTAGILLGSHSKSVAQTTSATYQSSPTSYSASIGLTGNYDFNYNHAYMGLNVKRVGGSWVLGTDGGNNGGALITANVAGELRFYTFQTFYGVPSPSNPSPSTPDGTQVFTDAAISARSPQMAISPTGQVKIGVTAPTGTHANYKLAVDGKLVAKSVYVTSPGNWADFVFEPTNKRLPLPALEQYLQVNKHLPSIPSAKEVETNGYSLGEMDAKLLQSVEELTLYVIELSKTNEQLAARVAELERLRATTK